MKRNPKGQFIKGTNDNTFEGFNVWYDKKGYPIIWMNSKPIKIHILIWERVNGEKPKGFVLHHKDRNRDNYAIENLELLSESDHKRIHTGWVRKDNQWIAKPCNGCGKVLSLDNFFTRKGHTPSALCRVCHNVATRKRRAGFSLDERLKMKVYKHEYYEKNRTKIRVNQHNHYERKKGAINL